MTKVKTKKQAVKMNTGTAAKGKQKEISLPLWDNEDQHSPPSSPLQQVKRKRSKISWDSDRLHELDDLFADVLEKEAEPVPKRGRWDAYLKKS